MGKNKIIIYFFISFVCFLTIANFFLILTLPKEIQAETKIEFKPQIPIKGFTGGKIKETSIGEYIIAIYKYAIGVVGILAAVVMMFGGVRWIMAGGNASAISEAKAWITASLTGLLLALGSWMILNTVNPSLVTLQPINITKTGKPGNCCSEKKGSFSGFPSIVNNQQQYSCQPRTEEERKEYGNVEEYNPETDKCVKNEEGKYQKIAWGCCQIISRMISHTGTTYNKYTCKNTLQTDCKGGILSLSMSKSYIFYINKTCVEKTGKCTTGFEGGQSGGHGEGGSF